MSDADNIPVITATPDTVPGVGTYSIGLISVAHRIAQKLKPTEADFAELRARIHDDANALNEALDRAIAGDTAPR